jgi:hypothetical protein
MEAQSINPYLEETFLKLLKKRSGTQQIPIILEANDVDRRLLLQSDPIPLIRCSTG